MCKSFYIAISLVFFIIGCSSNQEVDENEFLDSEVEFRYSHVQNPDSLYSLDDFLNAGWKKSKSFIVDGVDKEGNKITPDALEIWYGFFNRKDIEIRFYSDHSVALDSGVKSAETAVKRAVNANSKGGIITSTNNRVSYQSYVVAGNAVILCQDLLNNCVDLASKLD